jgi:hypothetical protein
MTVWPVRLGDGDFPGPAHGFLIHPALETEDNGMPQPDPTPDGLRPKDFLKEHWKEIVMILEALVILGLALRLLGFW